MQKNSNGARIALKLTALIMAHGLAANEARAQSTNAEPPVTQLPGMVVTGEAEYENRVQPTFLPPVQGTKINAGKKNAVIDLDEVPRVVNNNYRQALSQTPGLLLSEETSPLVSIGYRGLNPHRAQFTQMLKDGIPIHADMFGYPEAYYTPPLDTIDRIEFLHGGASLMYGPQPGGALNYVTHMPRTDKVLSARTQHILGSDNLYSTFNSVDGTVGRVGYYAYFNHRQTDGFRDANSDYDLFNGSVKLTLDQTTDSRWMISYDGYAEEHGEPGGLSSAGYHADRDQTTRFFDRFCLDRHVATLRYEKDFSEGTQFSATAWGGYYSRFSRRQRGGGFGTLPSGPNAGSNSIEHQEFWTEGVDARLRHDWMMGGETHTLAVGVMGYHTDSPRTDERGATPDADEGQLRNESRRDVFYAPVFIENRFNYGKFSVTPGVRLENIWQGVEEKVNVDKQGAGVPLRDDSDFEFVPLVGVGMEYEIAPKISAYGNVSQSYRPKIFTEAVPTSPTTTVAGDLEEGKNWLYEIGVRGNPVPYLTWDASLFYMDFRNQIGTVSSQIQNVGRSLHKGAEAALELDLVGVADDLCGNDVQRDHAFSLYANATFLDAEFIEGPVEGNEPQYAPDYTVRAGGIYRWKDRVKVGLLGTFVERHWANDNNGEFSPTVPSSSRVPAYMVWDLTAEAKVYRSSVGDVSVIAGINNLLDEDYYARIRSDGIDPAYRRNYYAGLSFTF